MSQPALAPGRLVRVGVVLRSDGSVDPVRLARMAAAAGVEVVWCESEDDRAAVADRVEGVAVLVLPATDEPWARTLSVSIGRTTAEAHARRAVDPDFGGRGDPIGGGLFGALEDCQAQVARLAQEGIVDLRCVLPDTQDVHDVMAQLTAVAIGEASTHHPDRARSPDPEPPLWAPRRGGAAGGPHGIA
jgi:hypothetical protein